MFYNGRRGDGCLAVDMSSVESLRDGIRWDLYPRVGTVAAARAYVVRLCRLSRRRKTVDADAWDLERFLAWSEEASPERWIEADEGDVLAYLDDLRCRASSWNQCGAEACAPSECGAIRHSRIAEALSPSMWSLSVSCRSI
jgi:hypothetical protein